MNIDKAIELLQLDLDDPGSVPIEDLYKAQELSVEALDAIITCRQDGRLSQFFRLPGETKD